MVFLQLFFICLLGLAQELELTTSNVQVFARIKNCFDYFLCTTYDETLSIEQGYYRWKVKFHEPLSSMAKAFDECSVGPLNFEVTVRDENGVAKNDFPISRRPLSPNAHRQLLPMELYDRTYEGLKGKEQPILTLLESHQPEPAMKSTIFELEFGIAPYTLHGKTIPRPNVLAETHHLHKTITYDLGKWDGTICRFYHVMRHEAQHVRSFQKRSSCVKAHLKVGNHDERSAYLNDLVFLKRYCPEDVRLYKDAEALLLRMYQNKNYHACSGEGVKGSEGSSGQGSSGQGSSGQGSGSNSGNGTDSKNGSSGSKSFSSFQGQHLSPEQQERVKKILEKVRQMTQGRGSFQALPPSVIKGQKHYHYHSPSKSRPSSPHSPASGQGHDQGKGEDSSQGLH